MAAAATEIDRIDYEIVQQTLSGNADVKTLFKQNGDRTPVKLKNINFTGNSPVDEAVLT